MLWASLLPDGCEGYACATGMFQGATLKDATLSVNVDFEAHMVKEPQTLLVLALMTSSFINKT